MKGYWSLRLPFWLRNGRKLARRIVVLCDSLLMGLGQDQLAGVGSVAVAVGISDMLEVTGDT